MMAPPSPCDASRRMGLDNLFPLPELRFRAILWSREAAQYPSDMD
jgi:hypothetical protein